ncbi:multidrug efflux SMR transporter [Paenibacillus lautus]|jgi:paired small multidrug resistance pump|uniref:QacE family quaternary ammonium compound efflux SMR transporter n=1 Tax=Paenibacillus lautus TaxID=1401 RepID=A0A2A5LGG3_PAELA|nr:MULTISPECIES: multidrug efflux SMR transporter [Paenibacillus]MBY0163338.1 multidrug efflux SMR transporter [Cytobacillus firmus]VTR46149.1 drug resistance protein [Actinobacillus pleuropneumoniae]AYB47670.1 QacE family quaternary ammonium compound efflux SMR transporter [Paenibacillus lautus]EGG33469.1 multidrug resistance protein, SMR family [Paenibacillus sp. HGF5]ETT65083.1 small multidrug resistance protein [Paenibacillus sp. FSL H8-457]
MAWIALIFAGLFEIGGVIGIKGVSDRKGWRYVLILALSFAASFSLLSYAMTELPMGTAYAIWTGIGTAGGALTGMFLFGEPKEWRRVLFIAMILCSAVGLKLIS